MKTVAVGKGQAVSLTAWARANDLSPRTALYRWMLLWPDKDLINAEQAKFLLVRIRGKKE
jgi:hypothetical protein